MFGIGYTDANDRIFGLNLMAIATLILTLFLLISIVRWRPKGLMTAASIFIVSWMVLLGIYPWFIQQFVVRPNELVKEINHLAHDLVPELKTVTLDLKNVSERNIEIEGLHAHITPLEELEWNTKTEFQPLLQEQHYSNAQKRFKVREAISSTHPVQERICVVICVVISFVILHLSFLSVKSSSA